MVNIKNTNTNKECIKASELNQEVLNNIQISSQESMIIKSLQHFYSDTNNINLFLSFLKSESQISIRLIDYYVTKYSKNNKISYKIFENNTEQSFNVHTSYKQQLKAYQKKHFDPFSRGDRIPYFMNDTCVITTIGQLNFFKWFITKNINDHIKNNAAIIEIDMNNKNKNDKNKNMNIKKDMKHNKVKNIILTKNTIYHNRPSLSESNKQLLDIKKDKIIVSFSFN